MPPRRPTRSTRAAAGAFIFSPATGSTAGTAGNSLHGSESAARCWSFAVCSPGRTRLFASAPETRRSCAPRAISSRSTPTRVSSRRAPESSSARRSTRSTARRSIPNAGSFFAATACCIRASPCRSRARTGTTSRASLPPRPAAIPTARTPGRCIWTLSEAAASRGRGSSMWGRISRVSANASPKGAY